VICSSAPLSAGWAAKCSSISDAAREMTPRAAARSTAESATSIVARASPLTRLGDATRANAASAMPREAEA
jgi:hypothetical protein